MIYPEAAFAAAVAAGLADRAAYGGLRSGQASAAPESQNDRPYRWKLKLPYLWKLLVQAASPHMETVYLDNDILTLDDGFVDDLLDQTLLVSDLAMAIDPARPLSSHSSVAERRKVKMQIQSGSVVNRPPMYGHGIPPLCSCLMAFRRTPSVNSVLLGAAARLILKRPPTRAAQPGPTAAKRPRDAVATPGNVASRPVAATLCAP